MQLGRLYLRDLKRCLRGTFAEEASVQGEEECRSFVDALVQEGFVAEEGPHCEVAGSEKRVEAKVVEWIRQRVPERDMPGGSTPSPSLAFWAAALDCLQRAVFERLGDASQRIEDARQRAEALALESSLKETWIARVSLLFPPHFAYFPPAMAGALFGTLLGLIFHRIPLAGYFAGGILGGIVGLLVGYLVRRRWKKETFTLGEFPKSAFADGFSPARTLEHFSRQRKRRHGYSGVSLQLWGELQNQMDPGAQDRLDLLKTDLDRELCSSREAKAKLISLDRDLNTLRDCVEAWRARLSEVGSWEPGRWYSGDVFPADGPRKIYEWLEGQKEAEKCAADLLPQIAPSSDSMALFESLEALSSSWGKEKAQPLELTRVLAMLDDRPDSLLERMSEASAPLWPRPGDRDELIRCFGADFQWLSKPGDLYHSVKDETICLRILSGLKSAELMRS